MRTSRRDFAVLLFDEVELLDVTAVMQIASSAGRHYNWQPFRLIPVAERPGLVTTRSQLKLEATTALGECERAELLLLPGGYGARRAAQRPEVVSWCARVGRGADLVVAVGAGVALLAAAGLLTKGSPIAVSPSTREWLSSELPDAELVTDRRIVESGPGVISAADGIHGVELGFEIVQRTLGERFASSLRARLGCCHDPLRLELTSPPPAR